jgi:hypothetical protein
MGVISFLDPSSRRTMASVDAAGRTTGVAARMADRRKRVRMEAPPLVSVGSPGY